MNPSRQPNNVSDNPSISLTSRPTRIIAKENTNRPTRFGGQGGITNNPVRSPVSTYNPPTRWKSSKASKDSKSGKSSKAAYYSSGGKSTKSTNYMIGGKSTKGTKNSTGGKGTKAANFSTNGKSTKAAYFSTGGKSTTATNFSTGGKSTKGTKNSNSRTDLSGIGSIVVKSAKNKGAMKGKPARNIFNHNPSEPRLVSKRSKSRKSTKGKEKNKGKSSRNIFMD